MILVSRDAFRDASGVDKHCFFIDERGEGNEGKEPGRELNGWGGMGVVDGWIEVHRLTDR
jgi:hypothetical protein